MPARTTELLLLENVEALGIVGDIVKVRLGYARNYLLPRNLATQPSPQLIQELASKRAAAEREIAELRKKREAMIKKLEGIELSMIRSCNDQGVLYAAVTQTEIAKGLAANGYDVGARDVRLSQTIKRIGHYEVVIKFATDLEATIQLDVKPDRQLDEDEDEAPEAQAPEGAAEGEGEAEAAPAGDTR